VAIAILNVPFAANSFCPNPLVEGKECHRGIVSEPQPLWWWFDWMKKNSRRMMIKKKNRCGITTAAAAVVVGMMVWVGTSRKSRGVVVVVVEQTSWLLLLASVDRYCPTVSQWKWTLPRHVGRDIHRSFDSRESPIVLLLLPCWWWLLLYVVDDDCDNQRNRCGGPANHTTTVVQNTFQSRDSWYTWYDEIARALIGKLGASNMRMRRRRRRLVAIPAAAEMCHQHGDGRFVTIIVAMIIIIPLVHDSTNGKHGTERQPTSW
jgi:hypothetical protein